MRSINAVIRTAVFALSFFGALVFPLAAALLATPSGHRPRCGAAASTRALPTHSASCAYGGGWPAQHLGLVRHQLGQQLAEAERLRAEVVAHERVAAVGGIALVEDQIDHCEHRGQACPQLGAFGHVVGQGAIADQPLRAHEALRDRGLGTSPGLLTEPPASVMLARKAGENRGGRGQRDSALGSPIPLGGDVRPLAWRNNIGGCPGFPGARRAWG
jgi:hypothetical protein